MNVDINLELIVSGIIFIFYLLIQLVKLFISIRNNKKNNISNNNELVNNKLIELIEEAEGLFDNGIIKKEFVLESINDFLVANNISFDVNSIDQTIEQIISLSKNINYKENNNE